MVICGLSGGVKWVRKILVSIIVRMVDFLM